MNNRATESWAYGGEHYGLREAFIHGLIIWSIMWATFGIFFWFAPWNLLGILARLSNLLAIGITITLWNGPSLPFTAHVPDDEEDRQLFFEFDERSALRWHNEWNLPHE